MRASLFRGGSSVGTVMYVSTELGCTEIELLVKQTDIPEIPLFCSAELHIEATVRVQARLETIGSYIYASGRSLKNNPGLRDGCDMI